MDFLEKDLEEIIFKANKDVLRDKGLNIAGKLYRQVKIGNYGIADLISVYRDSITNEGKVYGQYLYIDIYELKKDKIGVSAFMQALNYYKGIHRYLKYRKFGFKFMVSINLIGREIDKNSSYVYLSEYFFNNETASVLSNYTYHYDENGIQFENESGYNLVREGFKS